MATNEEIDLTLAIQLQAQFEEEYRSSKLDNISATSEKHASSSSGKCRSEKLSVSLIDTSWELVDPNPNMHALFIAFDKEFFWGALAGIEVKWSSRMTLCAGLCNYEGRGGLCSVRLSQPLLKFRPRKDLIETLLHEMIHAYLFVTQNNKDHDAHGPEFHKHMHRINSIAGTKISVYHSFHDEVNSYRQHVWLCNGPCRKKLPYYGIIKRSMNRAPSPRDPWWAEHQRTCGGSYNKIQEPDGYGVKRKNSKIEDNSDKKRSDIRKFFKNGSVTSIQNTKGINSGAPSYFQHSSTTASHINKGAASNSNVIGFANNSSGSLSKFRNMSSSMNSVTLLERQNKKEKDTVKNTSGEAKLSAFSGKGFKLGNASTSQEPLILNSKEQIGLGSDICECPICGIKCIKSQIIHHVDKCLDK